MPSTEIDPQYLQPSEFIESADPDIIAFAEQHTNPEMSQTEKAVALYYAVRDGIIYNPYVENLDDMNVFKASTALKEKKSFCIPKAILLAAVGRAAGVPARLGFANVRNHLTSEKLKRAIRTDIVAFHGYMEFYLEGKWVKATPAFNARLCRAFKIKPLEFDGSSDSVFHEFSADGHKHMEYLAEHGSFVDLPVQRMWDEYKKFYPHWFEDGASIGEFFTSQDSFEEDALRENKTA